jgi:tRNA (guanine37-N1)-methyltransferase
MALRRTAAHRPDLIAALQKTPRDLDRRDRQVLAEAGFPVNGEDAGFPVNGEDMAH